MKWTEDRTTLRKRLRLLQLEDRTVPSAVGTHDDPDDGTGHGPFCPCPTCGPQTPTDAGTHEHYDGCGHERIDPYGHVYFVEPVPAGGGLPAGGNPGSGGGTGGSGGSGGNGPTPPVYHSRPDAEKKIFLDFDGDVVEGTFWNGFNNGNPIHAPAFDVDGDGSTFNSTEMDRIEEIWSRAAEDFSAFNVDVTTEDPGEDAFTAGGQAIKVLISTNVDEATGYQWYGNYGGVAYLDSWYWDSDTPAWAFENVLGNGNAKWLGEVVSHEVGHTFGLNHDGEPGEEYYGGHGSGDTGWAPIMGVGYYKRLTQWSRGEYSGANNGEDDVAAVAAGVGFVPDDHGDTAEGATALDADSDGNVAADGLIETRDDLDVFEFSTLDGQVTFDIQPYLPGSGHANLDILAEVYDADDNLVASSNPANKLEATFDLDLDAGTYTLRIDGAGKGDPLANGYTDYASIGLYTVEGTVSVDDPNDPPVAEDDNGEVDQGGSAVIDVLANDSDPDGDDLEITDAGSPANGTAEVVDGGIEYTPAAGFAGEDTFAYAVADPDGETDSAVVTVTVNNLPPEAADDDADARSGYPVTVTVLENDTDPGGDALTVTAVGDPANGTAGVIDGDRVEYTPDADFTGTETFVYTVGDGNGGSDTATVTVTVEENRLPTAEDDGAAVDEDGSVEIDVLANDSDPDGDDLEITEYAEPGHGTVSLDGDVLTYTPGADFHGTDGFTYTADDGFGGTATAAVTVTVNPVNDDPVAGDDTDIVLPNGEVNVPVLANDFDIEEDEVSITGTTDPEHGDVEVNPNGTITYIPDLNYVGTDNFTYTIGDGNGGVGTGSVTVSVRPPNRPPVAVPDSAATDEGEPIEIDVLANDSDPEGDALAIERAFALNGEIDIEPGGTLMYTPDEDFTGTDFGSYVVIDEFGESDVAEFSILVGLD